MTQPYDQNPYGAQRRNSHNQRPIMAQYGNAEPATAWEANRASALGQSRADIFMGQGQSLATDATFKGNNADAYMRGAQAQAGQMYAGANASNAQQNAARADAMSSIGRLRSFYEAGPGPSAAQAQLLAGQDANARNAMSIARSGGLGGGAAAQRRAMNASVTGGQQTNQAAGVLRAQEAAQWQQTRLGAMQAEQSALQGVRAGDAGVMNQQLGAGQGMSQTGLGYGQLAQGYGQQAIQARHGMGALAGQQMLAGESNRGAILGGQLAADSNRYSTVHGSNERMNIAEMGRAERERAAAMQTVGTVVGTGAMMMSDESAKTGIRPVSSLVDAFQPQATSTAPAPQPGDELSRLRAKAGPAPQNDRAAIFGAAQDATIQALDAADGRAAQDTAPRHDLRPAQPYSYEYKDPGRHGQGQFVGPMAQDLEHLPGVVQQQPDGTKAVDTGRVALVTASAVGEQQKEIERLKALLDQSAVRAAADTGPRAR